eukprot:m.649717 g.649717  ORF g.649717 m.649717 type:complete len:780 (-) comp22666_c0_seq1:2993-5332(-)
MMSSAALGAAKGGGPVATSTIAGLDGVESLTDIHEIRKTLDKLRELERDEDGKLWQQLSKHSDIEVKMSSLHRMAPKLSKLQSNAQALAETVGSTCHIAESVSSKVRELDMIKSRLQETMARVDEIIDLRTCVDGAEVALRNEQYEDAAQHIHRFLRFDQSELAEHTKYLLNEGESPIEHLQSARKNLVTVLEQQFDMMVNTQPCDTSQVEKFFKLFPLVGEPDLGLKKYGRFLVAQTAASAEALFKLKLSGGEMSFVQLMGKLVEGIASTIGTKSKLITEHYGNGQALAIVKDLQQQCDVQASKIFGQFIADNNVESLVEKIRRISRADDDKSLSKEISPRELDPLVNDIVSFVQRTEIYCRFVYGHVKSLIEMPQPEKVDTSKALKHLQLDASELNALSLDIKQRAQLLIGHYLAFEEHVLRQNLGRAIALNTLDGDASNSSALVDDVFFVVSKSARRAMSTLNADSICAVLNHVRALLETDYCAMFQAQIDTGLGSSTLADLSAINESLKAKLYNITAKKGGGDSGGSTNGQEDVLVAINSVAISRDFTDKLLQDLRAQCTKLFATARTSDREKVVTCLNELSSTASQFDALAKSALERLCASSISARLRTLVEAMARSEYYLCSEDDLANCDHGSKFIVDLISALQSMFAEYKRMLSASNYDALLVHITEALAAHVERMVLQTKFNKLGGVLFDKDLRILCNFLSSITQWSLRAKFTKCSQMATLLCLESVDEITEYYGPSATLGVTWHLSPAQVKEVLQCRQDLDARKITALRL